jgi:hypothetical protein
LPFLRFTRDKRGYETTALVHASRQQGKARQRILYWFRTPPGVKVGRPALDEEAIRWIEEHNPEIQFNWQKILEAQPAPAVFSAEDAKNRRPRRDKGDRRRRPSPPRIAVASPAPGALDAPLSAGARIAADAPIAPEAADTPEIGDLVELSLAEADPEDAEFPALEDALEQLSHPEAEEQTPPTGTPVEKWIAREHLVRLRARHSELKARITERGGDPARIEALRAQAESLNPDAWVTQEEARKGVEEFEPRIRAMRAALGLRRRRRSRRGGRRRRAGGPTDPNQAAAAPKTSSEGGSS